MVFAALALAFRTPEHEALSGRLSHTDHLAPWRWLHGPAGVSATYTGQSCRQCSLNNAGTALLAGQERWDASETAPMALAMAARASRHMERWLPRIFPTAIIKAAVSLLHAFQRCQHIGYEVPQLVFQPSATGYCAIQSILIAYSDISGRISIIVCATCPIHSRVGAISLFT